MMELSGFALLMSELDAPGIWPDVRALWDRIFSDGTAPALAGHLSAVLSAHENLFAITPGGVGRTERKMALARLMSERGITSHAAMWGEPARARAGEPNRRRVRPVGPRPYPAGTGRPVRCRVSQAAL